MSWVKSTLRGHAAFLRLNVEQRKLLSTIAIQRTKLSASRIDLQQSIHASNEIFGNDSTYIDFLNNCIEYIDNMTLEQMDNLQLCEQKINVLDTQIEHIRIEIRKKAYRYGWNALCFFPSNNNWGEGYSFYFDIFWYIYVDSQ